MSKREENLPVLVNPPEKKTVGQKDSQATSNNPTDKKTNWLGTLLNRRGGSDFIAATSPQGMYVRKKRLLNTTVIFLALDIILVSLLVLMLTRQE